MDKTEVRVHFSLHTLPIVIIPSQIMTTEESAVNCNLVETPRQFTVLKDVENFKLLHSRGKTRDTFKLICKQAGCGQVAWVLYHHQKGVFRFFVQGEAERLPCKYLTLHLTGLCGSLLANFKGVRLETSTELSSNSIFTNAMKL